MRKKNAMNCVFCFWHSFWSFFAIKFSKFYCFVEFGVESLFNSIRKLVLTVWDFFCFFFLLYRLTKLILGGQWLFWILRLSTHSFGKILNLVNVPRKICNKTRKRASFIGEWLASNFSFITFVDTKHTFFLDGSH